jgi:oligopeptide/dipeptide ABC transporter ATP-binding protein
MSPSIKSILQIRNLQLYYKFAPLSSTNVYFYSGSRTFEFKPYEFYEKKTKKEELKDDFEISKKLIQEPKLDTNQQYMKIVDGVNLNIDEGQNLSIIGESGCGKTTLLLSILNLPDQNLKFKSGEMIYKIGSDLIDLMKLNEENMRGLRGIHFGLIPQLARDSINPWLKIGLQTGEILSDRLSQSQEVTKEKVIEYLGKVTFPSPKIKINKYVHQLSGGEAQKVCIAMALISNPRILLADEILSSLDTISQAQVMELLKELHSKSDSPFQYIFTTHNITAAYNMSDIISVMYAGEIVEIAPSNLLISEPLHPYTQGLLSAIPWFATKNNLPLSYIPGEPPVPYIWPKGCRFAPRCSKAVAKCSQEKPLVFNIKERQVMCWLYEN